MAGIVAVIARVLPESAEVSFVELKEQASEALGENGAKNISFEEKPFAFGLKALFVKFAWPEEQGTDEIEELLSEIEGVSSVSIEDYRRAFG